jgi:hypothetical protein
LPDMRPVLEKMIRLIRGERASAARNRARIFLLSRQWAEI